MEENMKKLDNLMASLKDKDQFEMISQKVIWWMLLLSGAFVAVYALVMSTPLGNLIYVDQIPGSDGVMLNQIMYDMKGPNDTTLVVGLFLIISALVYRMFRCAIRKTYYISNIIVLSVCAFFSLFVSVFLYITVANYKAMYSALNFEEINFWLDLLGDGKLLETSSPIFAVGYVIATLVLISSLCSIALLVVKAIPFAKRVIKEHNEPKEVEVK